jgi:uncharacterized protein YndB with AHSA1/START domain
MPEHDTDDAVVIERLIDAPVEDVWMVWTHPEHFAAWYGPAGATIETTRIDLRPGGERVVAMSVATPGGQRTLWFTGEHLEVSAPHLLVYTEAMTDRDGGAPEPPVTVVRLELQEQDGFAHLRLTHQGIPSGSPGAAGWNQALDQLEALLRAG